MIYIVLVPDGMLLAAYHHERHAAAHARAVLGARVQSMVVHDNLLATAADDMASDDWDEEETPVQEPSSDITKTNPSTPSSKTKARKKTP